MHAGVRWWLIFFFKRKTAYEVRISDWSSDVCSSDLTGQRPRRPEIENLVDAPFIPQVINTAHIAEGLIGWRRKPQFLRKQFVRLGYLEGVHARRGKIEIVATVILPVHISRLRTQREIAELISGYERSEENTLNSSH